MLKTECKFIFSRFYRTGVNIRDCPHERFSFYAPVMFPIRIGTHTICFDLFWNFSANTVPYLGTNSYSESEFVWTAGYGSLFRKIFPLTRVLPTSQVDIRVSSQYSGFTLTRVLPTSQVDIRVSSQHYWWCSRETGEVSRPGHGCRQRRQQVRKDKGT